MFFCKSVFFLWLHSSLVPVSNYCTVSLILCFVSGHKNNLGGKKRNLEMLYEPLLPEWIEHLTSDVQLSIDKFLLFYRLNFQFD